MTYSATIHDQGYIIDTGENNAQREILVDGKLYSIDWRHIEPLAADARKQSSVGGRYSLLVDGKSYDVLARRITTPGEKEGQTYEIQVAGQRFEVHVEDEREKALTGSISGARETGEAVLRAPMPGLVLETPMAVGASVERGQTVIILEAMKMENDLAAPQAGTIKEVRVSKGQTVNQGDVLVVIAKG